MKGQHARLVADGGWGAWIPAFAYDMFKGEMWKRARSSGLRRYGKENGGNDDSRPIALAYRTFFDGGQWLPQSGAPALQPIGSGTPTAFRQASNTPSASKRYVSAFNVPENTGWTLSSYLYTKSKTQPLKLDQWWWGVPGNGFLFQIRDGKPEIGLLAPTFTTTALTSLNVLWATADPSIAQKEQIDDLQTQLFDDFKSLTFENSTSKSDWYDNYWAVTFIPEPRGNVHVVLEGADATVMECKRITETGEAGILWPSSKVNYFSAGGAWWIQSGYPLFDRSGKAEFGPHREGYYYAEALGNADFALNSYQPPGTSITPSQFFYSNTIDFGFRTVLATSNRRVTPWWYGFSARLSPGERDADNDFDNPEWDTDDVYEPANPNSPRYTGEVILDIVPSFDGAGNKTTMTVTVMDPGGLFTANKGLPLDSVACLTIDDEPLITGGIITSINQTDMRSLKKGAAATQTVGWNSELTIKIENGWFIAGDYDCDPPPIGDWRHVGYHLRAIFQTAGFKEWQLAGINPTDGPIIKGAPLGKEWNCRCDNDVSCADAARAIMESYGLFWRLYQDRFGVWQYKQIDLSPVSTFTSAPTAFSNLTPEGRLTILSQIDFEHNHANVYNDFIVVGGKDGEIVRHLPGARSTLKRIRTKKVTNTGLSSEDEVEYALRSLEWLYGRPGKRANYDTFFHEHLEPGQRIFADGGSWEIEALTGGSWARDEARYLVLEV